jgi:hypothetical protein
MTADLERRLAGCQFPIWRWSSMRSLVMGCALRGRGGLSHFSPSYRGADPPLFPRHSKTPEFLGSKEIRVTPDESRIEFAREVLAALDELPDHHSQVPDGGSHGVPQLSRIRAAAEALRLAGGAPA